MWPVLNATPQALCPQEGRRIHCTRDWVGPRASLNACGKSRPQRDDFFLRSVFSVNLFCTFKSFRPSSCNLCSTLLSLYNKHNTNIHANGWIRTHNPSKRTAENPRPRPSGHWDRHTRNRSPDRPARSESLHRLSYPSPQHV
jgi:hypothetical protein